MVPRPFSHRVIRQWLHRWTVNHQQKKGMPTGSNTPPSQQEPLASRAETHLVHAQRHRAGVAGHTPAHTKQWSKGLLKAI